MTTTPTHDVQQVAGWLRQCLSHDKRPIGMLIGAGCPCSVLSGVIDASGSPTALIPAIAELTTKVSDALQAGPHKDVHAKLLSHFIEDNRASPDVEKLLSHIRGLRSVTGESSLVRDLGAKQLGEIDDEICKQVVSIVRQNLPPNRDTPYDRIASWIRSASRNVPVEVFTTNYDLLMEQALERHRVPFFDGFVGAHEPFFEPRALEEAMLPAQWTRLWKLHGSINWTVNAAGTGVVRTANGARDHVAVIHPSHLKYEESRRMPYLAILDRFKRFLGEPSAALVVSGYSFGDQHINELIIDALRTNQTGVVFATMRGSLDTRPTAVQLATETRNLSLLGKDEAVISGKRGRWATRSSAETRLASAALDWTQTIPTDQNSPFQAQFRLGDFARMGEFFSEIVGDTGRVGSGS